MLLLSSCTREAERVMLDTHISLTLTGFQALAWMFVLQTTVASVLGQNYVMFSSVISLYCACLKPNK